MIAEDNKQCEELLESVNMKWSDFDPKLFEPEPGVNDPGTIFDYQDKDAEFWKLVFDKSNYWIEKGFEKEVSLSYSSN